MVHLSGIKLVAQPRPDADWDMGALGSGARRLSCQSELAVLIPWWHAGPARRRELSAKHARLAAMELQNLSSTAAATPASSKSSWSFLSRLGALIIHQLQLQLDDVSLEFQVRGLYFHIWPLTFS